MRRQYLVMTPERIITAYVFAERIEEDGDCIKLIAAEGILGAVVWKPNRVEPVSAWQARHADGCNVPRELVAHA